MTDVTTTDVTVVTVVNADGSRTQLRYETSGLKIELSLIALTPIHCYLNKRRCCTDSARWSRMSSFDRAMHEFRGTQGSRLSNADSVHPYAGKFTSITDRFFPSMRILHPLPCHRFDAKTRWRKRGGLAFEAHAGIYGGSGGQQPALP